MTVTAILSAKGTEVVSIEPTATLADAAKLLAARRIGSLVVLGAGGRLSGVLSERDIVRMLGEHGAAALDQPVGQVMTRTVATCSPDEPIESIMERMTSGKFRHMPVLDQNRLAGIVSIGDVVKDRLQAMERETEAMRDYIQSA
ncbi:MAG: CBS domain-containing protein [Xanthobacteraceae bacterium]|jgi:CBS domain-containing protein|uniref:CBS domain-containing protein n=1 Tax=Pseudolabrys sp. TaxID=1960880 RepID=UPI003D11DDEB